MQSDPKFRKASKGSVQIKISHDRLQLVFDGVQTFGGG
jgi:hypothetical protein